MADEKVSPRKGGDKLIDMAGQRFGRLTVKSFDSKDKWRTSFWLCDCICGQAVIVSGKKLKSGHTRSCGCLRREVTKANMLTHGASQSATYKIWRGILTRCDNPNATSYDRYGGRGIKVCERWESFGAFLEDMGERPADATVERRDNDADYCPDNCFWATRKTQGRNTSRNFLVSLDGQTKPLSQWVEERGLNYHMVKSRLYRGWAPERALSGK